MEGPDDTRRAEAATAGSTRSSEPVAPASELTAAESAGVSGLDPAGRKGVEGATAAPSSVTAGSAAPEPQGKVPQGSYPQGSFPQDVEPGATGRPRLVPDRIADRSVYAALDLGTNNCRLLVARPTRRGFQVLDAFSRIIRLGEGVSGSGLLSEPAMVRAVEALRVCSSKIVRQRVSRAKLVATEACRIASNGPDFIERVRGEVGLDIEILSREDEAKLAVSGCASLIDLDSRFAMVFDIGGGSSELIWLDLTKRRGTWRRSLADRLEAHTCIAAWTSLPVGVVSMAERFDGRNVTEDSFEAMVEHVLELLRPFEASHRFRDRIAEGGVHLLGTSGTVTTVAGILLGLPRYDRNRVDGCWLATDDVRRVTYGLLHRSFEQRVAEPCIGRERADLVLAGCAILEALLRVWPARRLRVADRGLREGILATMMAEDGHHRDRSWRRG